MKPLHGPAPPRAVEPAKPVRTVLAMREDMTSTRFTVLLALSLSACTPFSLSPPARVLPLESSATLDEGAFSVGVGGGVHEALRHTSGWGSVDLAYAPAEGLELSLEGTYAFVDYRDERSGHLGTGRVGLKYAPVPHVAIVGGVGAGAGAHGALVSPDIGLIFAYENPYLVPWGAARGLASLPVGPSTVTVTQTDGNGMLESFDLVPPDTLGWQFSTGLRLPLDLDDRSRLDLLAGVGLTGLYGLGEEGQNHVFMMGGVTARVVVGP